MNTFHRLLAAALVVSVTNNFVWFALTFWIYLGTKTVVSTSVVAGIFLVAVTLTGFWLGSLVDHHKKKNTMLASSLITLALYITGLGYYLINPATTFTNLQSIPLWIFVLILMAGVIAGNIYSIAVPTLITVLVPEEHRDKANGLYGTVSGIAFAITSVASGFMLAYTGMTGVMVTAIVGTIVSLLVVVTLPITEKKIIHTGQEPPKKIDIKGTLKVVRGIPGMMALILFATINNFLGGAFMSLMDAYGLTLVPVQVWGLVWGLLSFGFIAGGLIVAKWGLGETPLRRLFRANIAMWVASALFTVQPSLLLLFVGTLVWILLMPSIEATEQTIIQKVVPAERQGRVFGFAQSVEQAASPLMAFFIGPIAAVTTIPFMTTGAGVELIGGWYGTGVGRGIGLIFTITGVLGLIVTLIAMRSSSYKLLAKRYQQ